MVFDKINRWRKKYTFTLLCWVAGTVLAFYTGATLVQYTAFCGTLLAMFGTADLIDKGKFKQLANGNPE